MSHPVIEVRLRHVGRRPALAGAEPDRCVARAVMGRGPELIGAGSGDLNDQVVGFGDTDEEAPFPDRLHILAVGGDDRHRAAGEFKVEVGRGRTVDDTQQHPLVGLSRKGRFRLAVGQKAVVGHIRDVHGRHALKLPQEVVAQHAEAGGAEDALRAALLKGIPVAAALERPVHGMRVLVGPIGEHDHMVPVRLRAALERLDDDGAVNAALLLQVGVGVVPIGSALADGKFVVERFAGPDGREAEVRDAVHPGRDQDAVPVDGGILVHPVMDADTGEVSLPEAQGRARDAAVDGHGFGGLSREVDRLPGDGQIVFDCRPLNLQGSGEYQKDQSGNGCSSRKASYHVTLLCLNELPLAETELKLMAAAAIIGDNSTPKNGWKTPAAIRR